MRNRPLTITLPPEVFAQVVAGEKKIISTKRNPRKDRYFVTDGKRISYPASQIPASTFNLSK